MAKPSDQCYRAFKLPESITVRVPVTDTSHRQPGRSLTRIHGGSQSFDGE